MVAKRIYMVYNSSSTVRTVAEVPPVVEAGILSEGKPTAHHAASYSSE